MRPSCKPFVRPVRPRKPPDNDANRHDPCATSWRLPATNRIAPPLDPRTMNDAPPAPSRTPLAFWIGLGVPLLIVLIAGWQGYRADALAAAAPHPLSLRGNGMAPYLAPLATATLWLGLIATATFCAALLAMRRTAARAMQSRDALLQAFETGRRWLPVFLVLQTLLVFAGLAALLAFEVLHLLGRPRLSDGGLKLAIIAGLIALALLWYGAKIAWDMLRFVRHRQALEPIALMGRMLSPAQAPLLWEFVGEVARRTGAQLPDSVVVGLNEGFFVTEHPVALANGEQVPAGRVLYLPLPYMAFLDRDQVAAVVAHELGHFTAEDTRYGLRFTPIYRSLVGSILAVTNEHADEDDGWRAWLSGPASLYGKWFLRHFDEAVHHWSRERELAADAFGSRIAGTEPAALALLRSAVLHEFVEEALACNRQAPAQQRQGVLPLLRRLVAERGLPDPRDHLEDRQAHPLDTHPPLRQRLDALGVAITEELVARTRDSRDSRLLAELGLETH